MIMKKYIFLACYAEDVEHNFIDLERASSTGIAIVEWENPEDAFQQLRKLERFEHLGYSWDKENYICYELVDGKMTQFTLG